MKTIAHTAKSLETRAKRYLRNCFHDGQYLTERATDFWSKRDDADCLAGERKCLGSEIACTPLRFTGSALLVYVEDTAGKTWYSWIHRATVPSRPVMVDFIGIFHG